MKDFIAIKVKALLTFIFYCHLGLYVETFLLVEYYLWMFCFMFDSIVRVMINSVGDRIMRFVM